MPTSVRQSAMLTQFAVVSRYPGFVQPRARDHYEQALRLAEAAVSWGEVMLQ